MVSIHALLDTTTKVLNLYWLNKYVWLSTFNIQAWRMLEQYAYWGHWPQLEETLEKYHTHVNRKQVALPTKILRTVFFISIAYLTNTPHYTKQNILMSLSQPSATQKCDHSRTPTMHYVYIRLAQKLQKPNFPFTGISLKVSKNVKIPGLHGLIEITKLNVGIAGNSW